MCVIHEFRFWSDLVHRVILEAGDPMSPYIQQSEMNKWMNHQHSQHSSNSIYPILETLYAQTYIHRSTDCVDGTMLAATTRLLIVAKGRRPSLRLETNTGEKANSQPCLDTWGFFFLVPRLEVRFEIWRGWLKCSDSNLGIRREQIFVIYTRGLVCHLISVGTPLYLKRVGERLEFGI